MNVVDYISKLGKHRTLQSPHFASRCMVCYCIILYYTIFYRTTSYSILLIAVISRGNAPERRAMQFYWTSNS